MENRRIKDLLEKFYEGQTSLSEEQILKEFFGQESVPIEFNADRDVFLLFNESSSSEVLGEEFDEQILEMIATQDKQTPGRTRILYIASGIAAGFAILLGTYFMVLENKLNFKSSSAFEMAAIDDPELALEETRKALYLVSEVFNKGTAELTTISKFDEGASQLVPLSKFDQGARNIQGLGKFHEVEQLITKQ
jgi:hypothetical protein